MKLRILLLTLVIFAFNTGGNCQYYDKTYLVALDLNVPLSNTDYVSQISARGIKVGYREMINERLFGGIDFNATSYKKYKPRRTYSNGTGAITTDLFNYAYTYGATLSMEYYFKTEQRIMPFASFGIGASYIKYSQFFNVYSNQSDSWGVLLQPQAGVQIRLKDDSRWALQAAVHYGYSSAKNSDFNLGSFSNVGAQIGILILSW